ncbi:hypothetical protein DFH28DRAFT_1128359 [Melampsora americana]|nr:hypothetical protein DFH28DRAFT_1128359 [Melampsora americana]
MEINQSTHNLKPTSSSSSSSHSHHSHSHSQRQPHPQHIQITSTSSLTNPIKPTISSPNRSHRKNTLLSNQSHSYSPDRHYHQAHHHHHHHPTLKPTSSLSPTKSYHRSHFDPLSLSLLSPTNSSSTHFDQSPPAISFPPPPHHHHKTSTPQIPFNSIYLPPISPKSDVHQLNSTTIDLDHLNAPSLSRSSSLAVSHQSDLQSTLNLTSTPPTPLPIPPEPIRSFFSNSPLPAFSIPAQALHLALCKKNFVGKFEDPEEQGPIPDHHQVPRGINENENRMRNTSSKTTRTALNLTFPHISGEDADAGRDRTLGDLLKTTWSNWAAEELACKVLNYDLNSNFGDQAAGRLCWDLVRVLAYQDLRRWLNWIKELFKKDHEDGEDQSSESNRKLPSYEFRTKLRPSLHSRFKSSTKKKEDESEECKLTDDSSVDADVIMVPTIIKSDSSKQDIDLEPSSSSQKYFHRLDRYSPHHLILFTVTIIQAPSTSSLRTSFSPFPWNPPTPEVTFVTPLTPTKRFKTNITNQHPPTLHLEATLPLLDPLSQAASSQQPLSSHQAWLGETEARRVISSRSNKRRKSISNELKPDQIPLDHGGQTGNSVMMSETRFSSDLIDGDPSTPEEMNHQIPMELDSLCDPFLDSLKRTNMGRAILNRRWEDTPIGPIEDWSPTLRSMVGLILSAPYRMSLLWGEECVMLYNDAYVKTCGRKHPSLLGQSGAQGWAELWADLGEVADSVLNGEVYTVYDSLLFFDRDPENPASVRKEECYHSFSWIPVRGPTGQVEGILNPSFETTSRVVAERRLGTLRDLVQITLVSRNRISYKEGCLESISKNPYDLPFAIMYTCETKKSPRKSSILGTGEESESSISLQLTLDGTVAVPSGHPSAPESIEISIQSISTTAPSCSGTSSSTNSTVVFNEDKHLTWPLQEACTLRRPIYISDLGDRAIGFEKRGWDDEPRSAVVMPISTSEETAPLAVIVFGLSSRLYWTEAYALFINLLTRQLSTGLSTVIGHEEEAQRLEDLASLDRAKTAFFTNISHELRTPLTLIVGPISDILSSPHDISIAARDRLKVVERNTQRLINQVNQLLDLSRFEAGKMAARFRNTDLSKMTADLASLFRSAMVKNQLQLIVHCPVSSERVWVDHDFMEKVIFNLISNSMKFTGKGGKVVVQVRFDFSRCYLSVSDTGVGIKLEELPKIFERFHRVEDSAQQAEGTGIGLALVQDIIKLHRGTLEVESEVGRGSTFTATLLLGTAHLPSALLDYSPETELEKINDRVVASNARRWMLGDIEPISSSLMTVSPACSDSSSSRCSSDSLGAMNGESDLMSTSGSTILIADDNDDMRSFVRSVLSRYYNVAEASDGLEAYHWAKAHRPDLVVSDVMMPGLNGFELLKRLKTDPDTAGISVILLSARAGSEIRIEGLAEGADDYLVKPFEAKELVARINTHLQLSKMRQRLENAVTSRTKLLRENEARFKDLYHTFEAISMLSPVGIIQWDIEGKVTFANNAFRSQCKLNATDQSGENLEEWMEEICSDDQDRMRGEFEVNFKSQTTSKGEFRWKDGSWCLYELSPFYDEMKVFAGCLGSTTDVTARKESERRQLEAAEARARDAEESKRQQEAFIDMTSHEIRNPLHGIHQAAELLHTSLRSIYDNLVEDEDEEADDRAERSLSKSELDWFKQELEEDIDAVESIQLCASHQSRIADDIINVSKLSMGLLTTIKTEFNLLERVCEVLSMYLIEAQSKNVKLDIQVGEGLEKPAYIIADPNRLAQVTINFLSNALRYTSTSEGKRVVTIHVELFTSCPELDPEARRIGALKPELADEAGTESLVYAKVGVRDTARGLSQDELAKLFARFAQVNPTQDQYGGSGLGLYVSRCLIENHGGFIEVVSNKGQGSVFSFVIPAKRGIGPKENTTVEGHGTGSGASSRLKGMVKRLGMPNSSEKDVEIRSAASLMSVGSMPLSKKQVTSAEEGRSGTTEDHQPDGLRPTSLRRQTSVQTVQASIRMSSEKLATHVLVVEDNVINVKVIKRQLSLKGYSVSVAMDGRQGLDILYEDDQKPSELGPIGIVLMDIQMPVMNGLDAITELRASEKTGKVKQRYPVIAVTGNARKEQTEQILASGFDDICVKPYKIEDVQNRMEALLLKGV